MIHELADHWSKKHAKPYVPDTVEVRRFFQREVDYWKRRLDAGDPLLDQWMRDAHQASLDGLIVMDRLEKAGYDTWGDIRLPKRAQETENHGM